jgi:cation diffusion facilitator CzcD-associated flavoprotein CzcO
LYEAAWAKGGLQFRATFKDLLSDLAANETAASFIKSKIHQIVRDPATAALLANIDHPYAAKRPPIDSNYFETFNRDNVTLVDARRAPIQRVTRTGIQTSDADYPLDIIVFATGFDAMTGPLLRIDIRGRDGLALRDAWAAGAAQPSRPRRAGVPEPVHHHRARQPLRAVQHACRHRAACGLDHRLHRPAACRWRGADRGEAGGGGGLGGAGERGG